MRIYNFTRACFLAAKISFTSASLKDGEFQSLNEFWIQVKKKMTIQLDGYQWTRILYIAIAVFCWQLKYFRHIDNNYLIFQQSFYHAVNGVNLYLQYPAEYYDVFLYGPLFTVFVAPFALLPESLGFLLWELTNAAAFLIAIHLLPFTNKVKTVILLLCAIEFANSVHYMEFNPLIAALVIVSYVMVKKGKDHWATMLIISGAFMKLYPIVGLVFFVFSSDKWKFIKWCLIWSVIFLCLPAVISSPDYVIRSYSDWVSALTAKNMLNVSLTSGQDWSAMGVVRRLTQNAALPNWPFLLGGAIVFALPFLRFKQYNSRTFQLQVMCSALLMVVLFSTGSEHPTYIIATAGAVIYIMLSSRPFTRVNILLLVLLLVVTGLGPTDAFPQSMRQSMGNVAMKAWPCILIWAKISYELLFKDFNHHQAKIITATDNVEQSACAA